MSRCALAVSAALLSLATYSSAQGGPPARQDSGPGYSQYRDDQGTRDLGEPGRTDAKTIIIGEKRANNLEDRIVFRITPDTPSTSDLSIRVSERAILIEAVELAFADGTRQRTELVERIRPDAPSSAIPLDMNRGPLREVTLWKRPSWRPNEQVVQVTGKLRPPPPRPSTAEPRVIQRAQAEASRTAIRFDLARGTPPMKTLSLRSPNRRLLIERIELEFANGETQSLDVFASLDVGKALPPIDLGSPRPLRAVTVWRRPSFRPGPLELELIGQPIEQRFPPQPQWGGIGNAIPRGWILLGTQPVALTADLDSISVGREIGRFSHIALRIHEQAIYLKSITVIYANGQRDLMSIETSIPAGSQTKPIALAGDRFIDRIEMSYVSKPNAARESAMVEVYGDFADDWLRDRRSDKPSAPSWVMLGAQSASIFTTDRDAVVVGDRFGRIKALRLKAKRSSIRIYAVEVIFADGARSELPLSTALNDGEESQTIDLGPRPRIIDKVILKYRSKLGSRGAGILEIWGQS